MSAYLILGGNLNSREKKILEMYKKFRSPLITPISLISLNNPDTYLLSSVNSIGIEDIRDLEKSLSLKPYNQPPKIAIIQADLLTYEAQTAMLKTLEEPPGETIFLLHAPNANLLLPTILSRCQVVQLAAESEIQLTKEEFDIESTRLDQLLKTTPAQRLILADEWGINKDREQAIRFCQIQLVLWREKMLENPTAPTTLTALKVISKTLLHLNANVNPKLALDNLLLSCYYSL